MVALPETVLQFGSGRFLRGFADLFISHGNAGGQAVGKVVIVQSTGDGRAAGLNSGHGRYHVVVRGFENGEVVDRVEVCDSVSRALHAPTQWADVLDLARSPQLHTILSNTTEAGFALDPADAPTDAPPKSFPAKLLSVLHARWQAGGEPPTVIPCELIEGNAGILRGLLAELAAGWNLPAGFHDYLARTPILHTLVDRIVTGTPAEHELLAIDPMLIVAEPFAFWAIEEHPASRFRLIHPNITRTPDVTPYFLRKVRILNAAHTALLIASRARGFPIVREAVEDPTLGDYLRRLLFDEIVPTLEGRVDQPARFAEQTLERFRNPFLDHTFSDIGLHHAQKVQVRLVPTRDEFVAKFGRRPLLLDEILAADAAGV
jgi:tagaturonate reductase